MEAKPVRPLADEIQLRFFLALNELIRSGKIKSLKEFTDRYQLHQAKYTDLRSAYINDKFVKFKFIDIDAPAYLVRDYGVSAEWMLTGKGEMFKSNPMKKLLAIAI